MYDVVHLLDDPGVGGVMTSVSMLLKSSSKLPGIHRMQMMDSSSILGAHSLAANTIVVHFAIAWRKLPFLAMLRLFNPKSQFILQEHHYCAEHFDDQTKLKTRFKMLMRIATHFFDKIISVSETQASWLRSIGTGVNVVIAPIAELSVLLNLPKRIPKGPLAVGISGRFSRTKGIDVILNAIELPGAEEFNFIIAGYGEYEDEVTQIAQKYKNVEYIGAYDNPNNFLASCDVILIPSRQETFGLNCLEAKAAAKPVIVTRCSGLSDQASTCGVIVEPNDPQALIDGLYALLLSDPLTTLGNSARQEAARHNQCMLDLWSSTLRQEQLT